MRWRPGVLAGYAAWVALLAGVYLAVPGLRVAASALTGLSAVAAVLAGLSANRPADRAPWLLLAGACLTRAASGVSYLVIRDVPLSRAAIPPVSDALAIAAYALAATALMIFLGWRGAAQGRRGLLDGLILATALGLAAWLFLALPHARAAGLTAPQRAAVLGYPLADVLLLAMLARLLAHRAARTAAARLLALGAAGLLASGLWFAVALLHGGVPPGPLASLGWLLGCAAWGAAGLAPSMTGLTEPVAGGPGRPAASRLAPLPLAVLLLAALTGPGVLLAAAVQRREPTAGVIAAVVLDLLILARLGDAHAARQRAAGRERILREAATSCAAAATLDQVAAATRAAALSLTGPYVRVPLLALRRGEEFAPAAPDDPYAAELGAMTRAWLPALDGPGPRLVPAATPGECGSRHAAGRHGVLLCPLPRAGDGSAAAGEAGGVLAVFGEARALAGLAGPVEVLARQVALAADRIVATQELSRRDAEAYYRSLVRDTSDVILVVEGDGTVRSATPSAAAVFGDRAVAGTQLWNLVRPEDREAVTRSFTRMRDQPKAGKPTRWPVTRPDGTRLEFDVTVSDLRRDDRVGGMLLTLRDVTEQCALERELKHRAFHDALTGLPNRLLFQDRATHALARQRRSGSAVAVLVVDLDDFSAVNDTMGHAVGDELLVAAAGRLSALARESDTTARLGADEFALLIEDAADDDAVRALAERIVQAFTAPFQLIGGSVVTTASVGTATTEDSADAGDLVRHADLALYAAKSAGKRQWRRYQPVLSVSVDKRRELKAAIEDAVAGSAFTLTYQPIVVLATGEIAGFEALVRWPHPRWGMIHPDQFISLAEETGHIVQLGAWVLKQAVTDLVTWHRRVPRKAPQYISVNVSARQFRDPGFVASVREVLDETGLAPSLLLLELTESVLLGRDDRIRSSLTELKGLGVRLAIDDFGTGYSSLSYLRELPMDVLKIDRSFIEGIALSKARLALVEVIIRIAKTFGLTVTAEGIESEVQRELLISLGCEFGQGYLLERPVGAAEAEELVRAGLVQELHSADR
jgi:diguanylate cyclase (GGDEF)-like protein/PAS domain S-box-containing protein